MGTDIHHAMHLLHASLSSSQLIACEKDRPAASTSELLERVDILRTRAGTSAKHMRHLAFQL